MLSATPIPVIAGSQLRHLLPHNPVQPWGPDCTSGAQKRLVGTHVTGSLEHTESDWWLPED